MRWCQFKQQLEARSRLEVSTQVRTPRPGFRPKLSIHAFYALHALPVVFVAGATKKTKLIVVAVGGSPRPEKLMRAEASISTVR
ncbi:MAG: hypothetical protein DMG88_11820 [Acidobacteria bacterium]|nr:MAG: hypothetical protein DMG88_11820 [Acidobacteriota bacterium]